MDLSQLLVRLAIWTRRPPSKEYIYAGLVVLGIAVFVYVFESHFDWPDWLTPDKPVRIRGVTR